MDDTRARGTPQAAKALPVRFPEIDKASLPVVTLLARLKALGKRVSGSGPSWMACCPNHLDIEPSLSVSETKEGVVLIHCFAGCDTEAILDKLDLTFSDLYPSLYALQFSKRRPQGYLSFRGDGKSAETVIEPSDEQCAVWERLLKRLPIPPYALNQLSVHLGLPRAALLPLRVGYDADDEHGPYWIFAERDDRRRIVGLVKRDSWGRKSAYPGSMRGLTIPYFGKKPPPGPIHLVEGASDVAALASVGAFAIGRFNAVGTAAERLWLSRLLARHPEREIVVVGEREPSGVGRRGVAKLADYLHEELARPVTWALPRKGHKDSRAQIVAGEWHRGFSVQEKLT